MSLDNSHFYGWKLPAECAEKLETYITDGHQIRCVAFPPQGGNSWSVITDKTYFNRNIPDECHDKMGTFKRDGHQIRSVAFPPKGGNSWSVITDKTYFNRNIPDECHDKMGELKNGGQRVVWVAFPPQGSNSWSVITDKSYFNRNIPDECHDKMGELKNDGQIVRRVAFPEEGGNRWTILTDKGFFNRNIPAAPHRVMRSFMRTGLGSLECVAYAQGDGFVVVGSAEAFKATPKLEVNGKAFSLADFATALKEQLEGKGVKYGVMVRYKNAIRTSVHGPKRTAITPPEQDFTVFDWFNPASVSKTLSSVAVLQLLDAKNLDVNELVFKHLPPSWQIGKNVKTVTVAELLNHRSGFRGGATSYADLKEMVADGINLSDKVDAYCNCNTALARIVAVFLDGYLESGSDQALATSQRFISIMQKNIFDKLGIPAVAWKPDSDAPTLFFPNPPAMSSGTAYGDWSLKPGSAGSHLSIAELSTFVNTLATSNALLSVGMKQKMDNQQLGWALGEDVDVGFYHRKRGFFPASQNGGAELNSGIWSFSTGVQAIILHNGPSGVNMGSAYNAAWKKI